MLWRVKRQQGTDFGRLIYEARLARGWSLRQAAKATGIGHTRLDELEKSQGWHTRMATEPSMEQVVQLARAYEMPVHELFTLAGFEPLYALDTDERELFGAMKSLSPAAKGQVRALIAELLRGGDGG